jgi:hypothetical protein
MEFLPIPENRCQRINVGSGEIREAETSDQLSKN